MSDVNHEKLGDRGKENIQRETRETLRPVIKELTKKFEKIGFRKEDFAPAIQKGIEDAKTDV
jgi:hypothetical protein